MANNPTVQRRKLTWAGLNRVLGTRKKLVYAFLIVVSGVVCFWNLGGQELAAWDESLYGINAYEMVQQGDYFNPYSRGKPDQWNVKPPFHVNLVRLSHMVFGWNEWGLRFPSACAAFVLVFVVFRFVEVELGLFSAILVTSMQLGSTGLVGAHSGRAGDTDAGFALFVFLACISLFRFFKLKNHRWLLLTSLFLGLAFFTKSTAVLLVIPGMVLYGIFQRKVLLQLGPRTTVLSVLIFLCFPLIWVLSSSAFGVEFEHSMYAGSSAISNNLLYDTFERFTGTGSFEKTPKKQDFILTFLDSRLNLWHILTFVSIPVLIASWIKKAFQMSLEEHGILLFCISILGPFLILLQISANVNGWYLVPLIPFFSVVTIIGMKVLAEKIRPTIYVLILLSVFTVGRHVYEISCYDRGMADYFEHVAEHVGESCLQIDNGLMPNETLYAEWSSACQLFVHPKHHDPESDQLLITDKAISAPHEVLAEFENLKLVKFK